MPERERPLYSPQDVDVLQRSQIRLSLFQNIAAGQNGECLRQVYISRAHLFVQQHDYPAAMKLGRYENPFFHEGRAQEIFEQDKQTAEKFVKTGVTIVEDVMCDNKMVKKTTKVGIEWLISQTESDIADINRECR